MKKIFITVLLVMLTLGFLQYAKQNIVRKLAKTSNSAEFDQNEMPKSK